MPRRKRLKNIFLTVLLVAGAGCGGYEEYPLPKKEAYTPLPPWAHRIQVDGDSVEVEEYRRRILEALQNDGFVRICDESGRITIRLVDDFFEDPDVHGSTLCTGDREVTVHISSKGRLSEWIDSHPNLSPKILKMGEDKINEAVQTFYSIHELWHACTCSGNQVIPESFLRSLGFQWGGLEIERVETVGFAIIIFPVGGPEITITGIEEVINDVLTYNSVQNYPDVMRLLNSIPAYSLPLYSWHHYSFLVGLDYDGQLAAELAELKNEGDLIGLRNEIVSRIEKVYSDFGFTREKATALANVFLASACLSEGKANEVFGRVLQELTPFNGINP